MGVRNKTIDTIRVYDWNAWQAADRFGRMRIWEQQPDYFNLNDEDSRLYQAIHDAFILCKNEISTERCVAKIMQKMEGFEARRSAERLYMDMCAFMLGHDSAALNKEWKRRQYLERLELVADYLLKEGMDKGKPELVAQSAEVTEKAAKLAGVYMVEESGKIKATDWKPVQIVAIKKQAQIEAAVIEEVENE